MMILKNLLIVLLCAVIHAYAANNEQEQLNRRLFKAMEAGEPFAVINTLVEGGADVNATFGVFDNRPCHYAIAYKRDDCLAMFLKKGADVNGKNSCNDTPLHKTSTYNALKAVAILLEYGPNMQEKNGRNETPLETARLYGRQEIVTLLENYENIPEIKEPESD